MAWLCGRGGSHRLAVAVRDQPELRLFDAATLEECSRLKVDSNTETISTSKVGTNVLNLSAAAGRSTSHLLLASTGMASVVLMLLHPFINLCRRESHVAIRQLLSGSNTELLRSVQR